MITFQMAEINKKLDENAQAIKVSKIAYDTLIMAVFHFFYFLQSVKECQKLLYCKLIKCHVSFLIVLKRYIHLVSDDEFGQNAVV
jgi:hypothetical protein